MTRIVPQSLKNHQNQGGSYVGVWNVAGNPAGVVPVTKENSADQANFFKYLKKSEKNNLTKYNQANLDKYPVSGDICHR